MNSRYNSSREFIIEKIVKTATLKEVIINKIADSHYKVMILTNHIKNLKKEVLIECQFSEDNNSKISIYDKDNKCIRQYAFKVSSDYIDLEQLSELTSFLEENFIKNRRVLTKA